MAIDSSIRSTIAFFDIFDYPLTSFEVWQYLSEPAALLEVRKQLEKGLSGIKSRDGYYFLAGRENSTVTRRDRYLAADKKIKKARWQLRLFSWLPWIKLIALANTIGSHNLRPGGDTDLFIVTQKNHLWLVKVCATIILKLTNMRPTPTHSADRLCLSFLVDEEALDLSPFRSEGDQYFIYWLAGLVPLYGEAQMHTKLLAANLWLAQSLPNFAIPQTTPRLRFRAAHKRDWLFFISSRAEKWSHDIQTKFMAPAIRALANVDQRVVMNDHVLKLHTVDRRAYFKSEHAKRLQQFI